MKREKHEIQKKKFSLSRENLTIRGYVYKQNKQKLPIAIISHGFMANLLTVRHYAKFLAELGYAAFCFDFPGGSVAFGKSDGKTTDMSVITEVNDLESVIEYASSLEYTDSEQILLLGCSQGGFVSALVAARLGKRVKSLILFYPALSIPDDARRGKMMLAKFDPENIPSRIRCGPMLLGKRYAEDVINLDAYEKIKNYHGDVLIFHGTKDGIVDISYSDKAAELYSSAHHDRRVEYHRIKGARHMFFGKHDRYALKCIKVFISAYNR